MILFEIRVIGTTAGGEKQGVLAKAELLADSQENAKLKFVQDEGKELDLDNVKILVRPFLA